MKGGIWSLSGKKSGLGQWAAEEDESLYLLTEGNADVFLQSLHAVKGLEEDHCAREQLFLGQFVWLEVPAVQGLDQTNPCCTWEFDVFPEKLVRPWRNLHRTNKSGDERRTVRRGVRSPPTRCVCAFRSKVPHTVI
jgi:hypothetical protein